MEQKLVQLFNRGMNRDKSISKADTEFAFDNHNIRITARDHDTLLSVTNERGNKEVENLSFEGQMLGYGVLNEYIIIFTAESNRDRIYRVKYSDGVFSSILVFNGILGFDAKHPIETITDYENEDIQKIYWLDGIHVLRFMNFSDSALEKYTLPISDSTFFDSNRGSSSSLNVSITKTQGGNKRQNGVIQYFITYYNKNGVQTGIVYSSPLVYLSPDKGSSASDSFNNTQVEFKITDADTSFEYIRMYAILRTSYEVSDSAFIVGDAKISDGSVRFIDSGSNLEPVDIKSLLYVGSKEVIASTFTHKDGTMFLGDIVSSGNTNISDIETAVYASAFKGGVFEEGVSWESSLVEFKYSDGYENIPYVIPEGLYPYDSQLKYVSSEITTFKGGEKYRFALRFFKSNGDASKAFWIGDKVNELYPVITDDASIQRSLAVCHIPDSIITAAENAHYTSVQLMIAEASYVDRSVKAQGIVSPTVFNLNDRLSDSPFVQASWRYRFKGDGYAHTHFDVTHRSDSVTSELQTSWWEDDNVPSPLYVIDASTGKLKNAPYKHKQYDKVKIYCTTYCVKPWVRYKGTMTVTYYTHTDPSTDEPVYTHTYALGDKGMGNNSKLKYIADWLDVYEKENIPVANRISKDAIAKECSDAKDGGSSTYNPGIVYLNYSGSNIDRTYSNENREYFFVDESIVTLNSPEIEYNAVNVDRNSALKFRIVGAARITGNTSDYAITAENFKFPGNRVSNIDFSVPNISHRIKEITSRPVYTEYSVDEDEKLIQTPRAYMMYMWHKNGSIPNETYNEAGLSVLKTKRFANMPFSYYTLYNNYSRLNSNQWKSDLFDVRQFDSISSELYELDTFNGTKLYSANIDSVVVMPNAADYPVFSTEDIDTASDILDLSDNDNRSTDPVHITYDSRPHAVFSLKRPYGGESILPYCFESDRYDNPVVGSNERGPFAPWAAINDEQILGNDGYIYREYNEGDDISDFNIGDFEGATVVSVDSSTHKITLADSFDDEAQAGSEFSDYRRMMEKAKSLGNTVPVYGMVSDSEDENLFRLVDLRNTVLTSVTTEVAHKITGGDMDNDTNELFLISVKSTGASISEIEYSVVCSTFDSSVPYTISGSVEFDESHEGDYTILKNLGRPQINMLDVQQLRISFHSPAAGIEINDIEYDNIQIFSESNFKDTKDWYMYVLDASYLDIPEEDDLRFINKFDESYLNVTPDGYESAGIRYSDPYQSPTQDYFSIDSKLITSSDSLAYIGELYVDYDSNPLDDIRYGGIRLTDVESNTFIPTGNKVSLSEKTLRPTYASAVIDCTALRNLLLEGPADNVTIEYNNPSTPGLNISVQIDPLINETFTEESLPLSFVADIIAKCVSTNDIGEDNPILFAEVNKDNQIVFHPREAGTEHGLTFVNLVYNDVTEEEASFSGGDPIEYVDALGNEGDTFFQRWDSIKAYPRSNDDTNQVLNGMSVMLESHINIEARNDIDRGTKRLTDIQYENFGNINPVFSQPNDFYAGIDYDEQLNLDSYRDSITWTMQKNSGAEIDEWSHITLADSLQLDGDKGRVTALRRFGNTLLSFQERGISEILFNSRTQISTQDGVPLEIANSGKVDGKRYITNKYGVTNKWSIVEGKAGLYFVDNLNKIIGSFNGEGIESLSTKANLDAWARSNTTTKEWNPVDKHNFISFYDKIHSDVYFVNSNNEEQPCLVYSEILGGFSGFFDYSDVPMMTNLSDKFVSYHGNSLWLQNEGLYGYMFGQKKPFWITWRIAPDNFSDKVWTNLEYRADFLNVIPELEDDPGAIFDYEHEYAYKGLEKIYDYLYEARYGSLDYEEAYRYFEERKPDINLGACTSFRNGYEYGRNLDWLYSNMVDFIVRTPNTLGIAGAISGLTKDVVENPDERRNELYKILPFFLQDGINKYGLYANINVINAEEEFGVTDYTEPSISQKTEICAIMLVRFVLDHFKTALEAVTYLRDYCNIFMPKSLIEQGYEVHFMIGDKTDCYCVEFINHEVHFTKNWNEILSNFYNEGFEPDPDTGKAFTNLNAPEILPTEYNHLQPYSTGLERYNIVIDGFSSIDDTRTILNSLMFTKCYKNQQGDDFWYSEYVGGNITVDTPVSEMSERISSVIEQYNNRSRNNPITWQTVHSCIYDVDNLTLDIIAQEDEQYSYTTSLEPAEEITEDKFIDGNIKSILSDKTFDTLEVWNEYQTTGEVNVPVKPKFSSADGYSNNVEKFRIWRMDIPRAKKDVASGNRFGLDRIRNPWVFVKLKKNIGNFEHDIMQLHDVIVKYFINR